MTLRDLKPAQLKEFAETCETDRKNQERTWTLREQSRNEKPLSNEERWNTAFSRGVTAVLKKLQSFPDAKS